MTMNTFKSRYDPAWVKERYDSYGEREWNRWDVNPEEEVKFYIHRHYLERSVKKGQLILEIGAGAGRFTQILAEFGAQIVVADLSSVQLEINKKKSQELGFAASIVDWIQLDVCDMSHLIHIKTATNVYICFGQPN